MIIRFKNYRKVGWIIVLWVTAAGWAAAAPKKKNPVVRPADAVAATQRLSEGDILLARKEYYPALIKYLEASRLNPNSEVIFNKLGIVYAQLLLNREASNALRRAIELNKHYAYAYNNLGSVYFATRELGRAEKSFKKAIKLNPNIASFHYNLGAVYFEKKKFQRGESEYRRALELDRGILSRADTINIKAPATTLNDPERHYYLARIYASVRDVDKTIENLQLASNLGFKVVEYVDKEPVFDAVRNDQRFTAFLEDLRVLQALR